MTASPNESRCSVRKSELKFSPRLLLWQARVFLGMETRRWPYLPPKQYQNAQSIEIQKSTRLEDCPQSLCHLAPLGLGLRTPSDVFAVVRAAHGRRHCLAETGCWTYMEALYLDHGYFFFAPNPGPSHLLRCDIRDAKADRRASRESPSCCPTASTIGLA